MIAYAGAALNVGMAEPGIEMLDELRRLPDAPDADAMQIVLLELGFLQIAGRHEEALRRAPQMRRELQAHGNAEMRAWLELSIAASQLVLGRRTEAQQTLGGPVVHRGLVEPRDNEYLRASAVFLAALAEAPPPLGTPWRSYVPTDGVGMAINRRLIEVFEAIEASGDPTPTVRRARDELAAMYHDRELYVQVLDAWPSAEDEDTP